MDYLYLFKNFKIKEKKGISAVIATVILVALTVGLVAVVATFVSNTVEEQTSKGTSCIDIIGELEINGDYTCYNSSSNEFQFSINIKNAEIDSLIVAIENSALESKTFEITNSEKSFENLKYYPGGSYEYGENIKLPEKNSGKTYLLNMEIFGEDLADIGEGLDDGDLDFSGSMDDMSENNSKNKELFNNKIELLSGGTTPKSIKIAPIIGENQCDISDSLNNIVSCDLLI